MDCLVKYDWLGNVRELENAMERAVILATGEYIEVRDLPLNIIAGHESETVSLDRHLTELPGQLLAEVERQTILATLEQTNWNKAKTAQLLGITRATLHKKLKQYSEAHSLEMKSF
jgi:two-component system response regulator HydG